MTKLSDAIAEIARLKEVIRRYDHTLEALSLPQAYEAERIGGVLAGCPRGPMPTPRKIAWDVSAALQILREFNKNDNA
jgi:hypothetical protein